MLMGIVVMAFLVGELSNIHGNFDPVNEFEQTVDTSEASGALQFLVCRGRSEVFLSVSVAWTLGGRV